MIGVFGGVRELNRIALPIHRGHAAVKIPGQVLGVRGKNVGVFVAAGGVIVAHVAEAGKVHVGIPERILIAIEHDVVGLLVRMGLLLHPDHPFVALILNNAPSIEWNRRVGSEVMHLLLFVVPEALDAQPGDPLITETIREHPHPQTANRRHIEPRVRSRRNWFLQPIEIAL